MGVGLLKAKLTETDIYSWGLALIGQFTSYMVDDVHTKAVFSYELRTMSGESGPDIVWSCPFTHVANNKQLSASDVFSPTGNTPFGLGEGWRLCKACSRQDMTQKVRCGCNSAFLSFSPEIKWLLFHKKSQEVLSPISASLTAVVRPSQNNTA